MKRKWEEPKFLIQEFEADEYVAACVVGTIACAIPGASPYEVNDGTGKRTVDNKDHGYCGNWANISFNGDTGSGYEVVNGQSVSTRPIYNITGYEQSPGSYPVRWNSFDYQDGTGEYTHTGVLNVTLIDSSRPNHS